MSFPFLVFVLGLSLSPTSPPPLPRIQLPAIRKGLSSVSAAKSWSPKTDRQTSKSFHVDRTLKVCKDGPLTNLVGEEVL